MHTLINNTAMALECLAFGFLALVQRFHNGK